MTLQCRTLEVAHSFGFVDRLIKEGVSLSFHSCW